MKKFTLITLLTALAFSPLCGETKTYWDTLRPYHRMSRVYWNVRQLDENSVRFKEFNQALTEFQQNCLKLQKKVEENHLGQDLMFDKYAALMNRIFKNHGYDRTVGKGKGSVMRMTDISMSHLFILLSNDFKTMREAGIHDFPTPEILKEWIKVFQYIRMFRYFREVADKVPAYSKNYAWDHLFEQRLRIMFHVSRDVQKILKEKMPQLVSHNDIHTETRVLIAYCDVVRKRISATDTGNYNRMAKGGKEDSKERVMRSDMNLAMRNIERILNRFKNEIRQRQQEEKRAKQNKKREDLRKKQQKERELRAKEREQQKKQAAQDAKARALSAQDKANLSRMNEDELASFMAHRYNSIFPADHAKSISADGVQKCMGAMTNTQKQYYESVKARYIRTGSSEKQAELKALKTVRPLLSTRQLRPSRAEMIRTLNK